jgi:hypothetical protein
MRVPLLAQSIGHRVLIAKWTPLIELAKQAFWDLDEVWPTWVEALD